MKKTKEYIAFGEENGIERLIERVKTEDILINRFSGQLKPQNEKLIEGLTSFIYERGEKFEREKWHDTVREAQIINKIYQGFLNNPLNKIVSTDNALEAFLIVTEQFLQYVNNIVDGKEKKNLEIGLSFSVNENPQMKRKEFYMELHDVLTSEINTVLSSLMFYEYPKHSIDIDRIISNEEVIASYQHFSNVQLSELINYAVSSWKYGGRKIKENDNEILFEMQNDLDESYFIINERRKSKENKVYLSIGQIIRDVGENFPKGNKISEYLNVKEFITCCYLNEYLSVDDLESCTYSVEGIGYKEISIRELVRAYFLLIEICVQTINDRKCGANNLKSWGVLLGKQEILDSFAKSGIEIRHGEVIIEQFTYRKGTDIFDAPLIKGEQGYLLLPNLLINIDVTKLILSLIKEIDTRGLAFESEIRRRVSNERIKCSELYFKDTEEYQCDIAIAIADNLYLCECKAWNEFKNMTGYQDMLQKMKEAKTQLDRIANRFTEEICFVNERLGFDKEHKFKSIQKLVITLNMLGLNRKIGDTYFVDFSCLVKFLDREKPGIRTYGKYLSYMPYKGYSEYEGHINNFKFMTMVKEPANIEVTRKNKKKGNNKIQFDEIKFVIPMYVPEHPTTTFLKKE